MGSDGVFPAEMPERGPALIDALDDDTAERLVRGRVSPDDAPPGYAGVARLLQAAAGPPVPEELAGQESATATFRAYGAAARTQGRHGDAERRRPGDRARPLGRAQDRLDSRRRGRVEGRGRVVALALAGVVVAGGLWTAAGAPSPAGLPSRAGAPQSGGAGSGAPGSLTQARPTIPPVTGAGANARAPVQPPAWERSTRDGGGPTASRASGHGAKEHRPGKPPKPKPKPKPEKSKPEEKPKPEHRR
jgi:hypothetical protein